MAVSGDPASEPSPHLISTEEGGAVLLLDDFGASFQKRMVAVLMLVTERSAAMMNEGLMT